MTALKHDNFVRSRPDAAAPRPTVQAANRDHLHHWCDLARGVEAFRGRWKPSILMALASGPRGLPDPRAGLPGPARRVLRRALRELQADGLVTRSEASSLPVYALSPDGTGLAAILGGIAAWSRTRGSSAPAD